MQQVKLPIPAAFSVHPPHGKKNRRKAATQGHGSHASTPARWLSFLENLFFLFKEQIGLRTSSAHILGKQSRSLSC